MVHYGSEALKPGWADCTATDNSMLRPYSVSRQVRSCVHALMYICIHTGIHTYVYIYIHTRTCIHTCIHTYIHIYIYTRRPTSLHNLITYLHGTYMYVHAYTGALSKRAHADIDKTKSYNES